MQLTDARTSGSLRTPASNGSDNGAGWKFQTRRSILRSKSCYIFDQHCPWLRNPERTSPFRLLAPALRFRTREFGHRTVSPLAVDLVCYDLRSGAPHTITLAISQDTQAAQDAVDGIGRTLPPRAEAKRTARGNRRNTSPSFAKCVTTCRRTADATKNEARASHVSGRHLAAA